MLSIFGNVSTNSMLNLIYIRAIFLILSNPFFNNIKFQGVLVIALYWNNKRRVHKRKKREK